MDRRRVALIGAEFEENLSLRYLASALACDRFEPSILPFNHAGAAPRVVALVLESDPVAVGISVPFQHRAPELLDLATALRDAGYRGHICVGGHFATFEYRNILRDYPGIDTVVRHEGEDTLRELCGRLCDGRDTRDIAGVVSRTDGAIRVASRRPLGNLDELPFPLRRGEPDAVLGVASSPMVGSRGCYADCSFCCIHAYNENALGPRYRRRSPERIAEEMAQEYHGRGVRLFVFNDDNFLVPSRTKNLERCRRLAASLTRAGLTDIGLVIKCRPNDVDAELMRLLKSMGLIRAYVGIETNSDEGIVSLNRHIDPEDNRRALRILDELEVCCTFNVLIFDPEATLVGVARNLDFMEAFSHVPFNFCRAEVYAGTPMLHALLEQQRLSGNYLMWTYEMRDPRVELLFRIAATAFATRNFKPDGAANLNMGLRFDEAVLRRFYPQAWDRRLHESVVDLSRLLGQDSVRRMREAHAFVQTPRSRPASAVKEFTLDLARRIARADLQFLARVKALRREIEERLGWGNERSVRRMNGRRGKAVDREGAVVAPAAGATT